MQADDSVQNHDVIFAHVVMQKVPIAGSWLTKRTTNNILSMFDQVSDELDESDTKKLCSVTWPTRVVGTCAQCGWEGTVHKCGIVLDAIDECESVFCWEHFEKHMHELDPELGEQHDHNPRPRHLKRERTKIQSVLDECAEAENLHSR